METVTRDDVRPTEVFYSTDSGFAVPTIASIQSLRRWPSAALTDINVVLLGMNDREIATFQRATSDLRVKVHTLSADDLAFFDKKNFNKTHVPYSTLARFLIPRFVGGGPDSDILYVDGDTWFVSDPKALLDFPAPDIGLLAAEDQSYFFWNDVGETGREIAAYFADLRIDESKGYFNAGVLKCRADEWASICQDCLLYLKDHLSLCRYHDQSALNAVVASKRVRLSPAWNFQTPYWGWGMADIEAPRLLHFVGGGKPWMGMQQAWSSIYDDYARVIRRRADPVFPMKLWNPQEQSQMLKEENWTNLKNRTIFLHRIWHRRELFRQLLDTAAL
jgi:lipopolysaccharide biosynthesis glycosyltransferase